MKTMIKNCFFHSARIGGLMAGVALLLGMAPSPGAAQDMDNRWLPWLGCWEAVDGGDEAPLLCVRPASEGAGVEFVTWAEGEASSSEAILADGVPRNAEREECQGIEEARFSGDGHRIYLKSDYVCEGGIERNASGILAMINPMEWVDIKAVDGSPWVLRYRLARSSRIEESGLETVVASRASAAKAARISASSRLTVEDIIEASASVDGAAVEALIVEKSDPFAVNADMLVGLDDAGVPDGVIDLVVAVSFPDRFAVKSGPVQVEEYADETAPRRSIYMAGGFYDPFYWGPGFGYSRLGYGYGYSPYYYGGYGWGYGSSYYGWGYGGYYRPSTIVVQPRSSGIQMIKGRQGYTSRGGSGYTGRRTQPRGGSVSSPGSRATASPGRTSGGSSGAVRRTKPTGGGSGGVGSSTGASASSSSKTVRRTKPTGSGGGLI
jgi:hypothetical protein